MGLFSNFYLSLHRTSFQEFVVEAVPSNTEKLFFSFADFSAIRWIDDEKEFKFNGKLYDVSKIERNAQGYYIYGVNDSLEEGFIAMIDHWKKSNSPGGKAKAIFQPQFCNPLDVEEMGQKEVAPIRFSFKTSVYNPPLSQTPSPPPELHS